MASPIKNIPLHVYEIPPERLAAWDAWDTRVSCADCGEKSGSVCIPRRKRGEGSQATHVPVEIRHHCNDFRKRRGA